MARKRMYKCRHCGHETEEKVDSWQHIKTHLEPDKLLTCNSCQFVTQYKHHLEYHERTHSGYKPFKCDMCDYQCVNKYMLKSHLKSHSPVCPYQCGDCEYAAKYVHSLKVHLERKNHHPNPLSLDGLDLERSSQRGGTKTGSTNSPQSSSISPTFEDSCILDLRIGPK